MLFHQKNRALILIIILLLVAIVGLTAYWQISAPTKTQSSQPPLYLGLDAYRHWDKLSYLELGDRVTGQSTADLAGSNADNRQYLRVLPDGEHVLFDQAGPGIVSFMRMQENYGGPWHLSLDGQPAMTIGTQDLGQMQSLQPMQPGTNPAQAFPYPLSLNPQESQGSSIIATSIPFQQHMLWTSSTTNGNFYALYRKLPYGTPLTTWNSATPTSDVADLLNRSGSDIAPNTIAQEHGDNTLQGGAMTPLVTLTGPSQIRSLTFRVPFTEIVGFGNARLLIYWDGESSPSVNAPLKSLVGDGAGVYQPIGRPLVNGWVTGANGDGATYMDFNLYWPMPFKTQARIAILSANSLHNIAWQVGYEPFPDPSAWWGTFHATYTSIPHPTPGQDMTFLDVTGSGKLVGTVINFTAPDYTLEGDPRIYLDDSQTPQIAVTGTEEWGLGGNYWNGGQQVSLPLGGLPSSTNNPPGTDQDGAALYRFLIADSIPFNRHLIVRWEHGGADESTHPYRATMLWYGTPAQTALLSDTVQPASPTSRSDHQYQSPGEQPYQLTSSYEYIVHSPRRTANGTQMTSTTSFTMALDPRNSGAFLRRTFDYCVPNQQASIFIDGHPAGTWYSAGAARDVDSAGQQRCWRDEDFPLPASLTQGKASVSVRIQFMPTNDPQNSSWTAFQYQMYSFVLPARNATVVVGKVSINTTGFLVALIGDEQKRRYKYAIHDILT